jgi:hypothetical protein
MESTMKSVCRSFPVLLFLFINAAALFSLPPQKLLYSDDWAYEALSILSREQRLVFFADSVITVAQMKNFLAEIDEAELSESGKLLLRELEAYLEKSPWISVESDYLSAGFEPVFQPELYFKSSSETPWIYDYHSRKPLLELPLNVSLGPYVSFEMIPLLGQNEKAATQHDNHINVPYDPVSQFDIHFPKRAYLSAGIPLGEASGIHFAIGTGEDFLGRTRTGSIILSDYMNKVSYAQLSIYAPLLKYTAEVKQMEVNKYQYMHYLRIRLHRTFSLTVAEGVMVNAPLELRFLNPLAIFHGFEAYKTYEDYDKENNDDNDRNSNASNLTGDSRIGSYFGVKLEFQPFKYGRFYALFAMNQLQLGIEKENWSEDLTPDALAFQGGAELSIPVSGGYVNFGAEGIYTYPYMYVLDDKKWSFVKEYPEIDNMKVRNWVGTPFGPDTIAGTLWAGYAASTRWSLTFSFVFSAQGIRSGTDIFDTVNYRPTPADFNVVVPPTGTPVYTSTAALLWQWKPEEWITVLIQPGYRFIMNNGHAEGKTAQGFEAAFSVRLSSPLKAKRYEF